MPHTRTSGIYSREALQTNVAELNSPLPMRISELDKIIEQSLRSFFQDISTNDWHGREREMLSLFLTGHLSQHCDPKGPFI